MPAQYSHAKGNATIGHMPRPLRSSCTVLLTSLSITRKYILTILFSLCSLVCLAEIENTDEAVPDSSDFITASLLIMQPDKSSLITYYGHAALRLQCPSEGLDYCFTFDAFTSGSYWSLLMGKERTTLLPVNSADFFRQYRSQNRKVYEHELNLSLAEERKLWQTIDNIVNLGTYMQTDYVNHGCAIETASIIASAVNGTLKYPTTLKCLGDTQSEIIGKYLDDNTWKQSLCYMFAAHDIQRTLADNEEKLMLPTILEMIWRETEIVDTEGNTRSILSAKDMIVYDAPEMPVVDSAVVRPDTFFGGMLVCVLIVSLLAFFTDKIKVIATIIDALGSAHLAYKEYG